MNRFVFTLLLVIAGLLPCKGQEGLRLEKFDYPYLTRIFQFKSQTQDLEMAYMDLRPPNAVSNVETVVLLHGKNFSGAYWGKTAETLLDAGYRVIIPDQIGFGKSSKPEHYQYSFHQLALNTQALLASAGVTKAHIVGHSMGGMLATRYALMYPGETESLVLINPIGLEDWKAKGVPYTPLDTAYQTELKQTTVKLRAYEEKNYYHGEWKPEYQRWVEMLGQFYDSPAYSRMAWNQALASDMIFTQPVCYEFGDLKVPVLLVIGQADRTAIGKDLAPPVAQATLGNYPDLGRQTAAAIRHAKLVELEGVGHLPHIEAFSRFIEPVREFLKSHASMRRN